MSKIQGKQVADHTITQNLLNLTTPGSGDTTSGATVAYVTNWSLSGGTVIGPAEDGTYTDGIFTDFTPSTPIGTAVDRFNEMFKLLAPTPPSGDWTGAFGSPLPSLTTGTFTARIIGTGASTTNVVTTQTPAFSVTSTVSTGAAARTNQGTFVFTIFDYNGTQIETTTITSGSTSKVSGIMRYTIADPYFGISGQAGFWTGVTAFSTTGLVSSSITPGITPRNLYFTHPTGQSKTGTTFYVDNATHNTAATGLTIGGIPTMTRFISGVPSLNNGDTFTNISFAITTVSSYFYAPANNVWRISGTRITNVFGDPDSIPATAGATGTVTNKTATVNSGYLESMDITVTPFNRIISAGTTTGVTYSNLRIDTVSNETSRLTSGTGNFPTSWGSTWGTNSGVSLLTNTDEMQVLNGNFIYPSTNYTIYGGGNYSTISNTRWATFNLGSFSSNSAFSLNINGAAGITSVGQANLLIYVKISGATGWVDGDAYWAGGSPSVDGDPAVDGSYGGSSATLRRITFGSITRTGAIIVRIGFTGTGPQFTSLTATNIV